MVGIRWCCAELQQLQCNAIQYNTKKFRLNNFHETKISIFQTISNNGSICCRAIVLEFTSVHVFCPLPVYTQTLNSYKTGNLVLLFR